VILVCLYIYLEIDIKSPAGPQKTQLLGGGRFGLNRQSVKQTQSDEGGSQPVLTAVA